MQHILVTLSLHVESTHTLSLPNTTGKPDTIRPDIIITRETQTQKKVSMLLTVSPRNFLFSYMFSMEM
jgi:hypothetical protein